MSGGSAAERMAAELAAFQQQQQPPPAAAANSEAGGPQATSLDDGEAARSEITSGDERERELRARLLQSQARSKPAAAGAPVAASGSAAQKASSGGLPKSRWLDEDSEDEDADASAEGASAVSAQADGGGGAPSLLDELDALDAEGGGAPEAADVPPTPPADTSAAGEASTSVTPAGGSSSVAASAARPEPPSGGSVSGGPAALARQTSRVGTVTTLHHKRCRSVDDFEKIAKIGEGTFGDVYKARCRRTNDIVALKQVKMMHEGFEGFPQTALREINILLSLRHTHVINAREMVVGDTYARSPLHPHLPVHPALHPSACALPSECALLTTLALSTPPHTHPTSWPCVCACACACVRVRLCSRRRYDKIFMVMDFQEHDLKQLMGAMRQPFTEAEVKRLMCDLTSALEYCHERWVFHRDLKTSNLLMNNRGEVSICDFGLARYYHEPPGFYSPTVVTLWYRAPEVLLSDGGKGVRTTYGPAIDVWSLGCIFGELVLTQPLLAGQGELDQIKRIFELLGTPDETSWPGCSELHYLKKVKLRPQPFNRLRDKFRRTSFTSATALSEGGVELLSSMLILNPEQRISARDALRHRYFSEEPAPKPHYLMPTHPSTHKLPPRGRK